MDGTTEGIAVTTESSPMTVDPLTASGARPAFSGDASELPRGVSGLFQNPAEGRRRGQLTLLQDLKAF